MAARAAPVVVRGFVFSCALACGAANYPTIGNVSYAPFPETVLDIVQPAPSSLQARPLVIAIHGGASTKGAMTPWLTPFLEKGFIAANVEYRSESDVAQAVQWLRAHADRYKLDWNHVVLLGIGDGAAFAMRVDGVSAVVGVDAGASPVRKGGPPVLAISGDPAWPQVFKWLRKVAHFPIKG